MKPITIYAARSRGSIHLFSAEMGMSLCGVGSSHAKHLSINGIDDPNICSVCRGKIVGLSVVLLNK
jgi:hypothetical protein